MAQRRETVIPPEALAQRSRVVGEKNALRPEAGYALGRMMLAGLIDWRMHNAGLMLRDQRLAWGGAIGLPSFELRQALSDAPTRPDVPEEDARRRAVRYRNAVAAVHSAGCPAWKWVVSVVYQDRDYAFVNGIASSVGLVALRLGLSALADHYRIPRVENEKAA